MWIIKIIKIKCFYPPRILKEHWCNYSCLQIPPRENWFQYVRRVYATPINFPCVPSSFVLCLYYTSSLYYLQLTRMYHLKLRKKWIWYTKAYSRGGGWGSAAPGPVKFMDSRGFSAPNGCHGQIPDYVPYGTVQLLRIQRRRRSTVFYVKLCKCIFINQLIKLLKIQMKILCIIDFFCTGYYTCLT